MRIAQKRKAGAILERGGISQRIINLAKDISEGSYKNAIEKGAQISYLVDAASYDVYWNEKAQIGKSKEGEIFDDLINGFLDRDQLITKNNPYSD